MRGVAPQDLRDSEGLRREVAGQLARVQSSLDDLLVDRPRRRILRPAAAARGGRRDATWSSTPAGHVRGRLRRGDRPGRAAAAASIARASHVEPDGRRPLAGRPGAGRRARCSAPSPVRSEALEAERAWLEHALARAAAAEPSRSLPHPHHEPAWSRDLKRLPAAPDDAGCAAAWAVALETPQEISS